MSDYVVSVSSDWSVKLTKIVRCKDCKYFGYLGDDMCYLPNGDGGFAGWKVDPEGFCAWGEREVME